MIFAIYNGLLRESALVNSPKSSSSLDLEHDYYQKYNNNDKMIMTMINKIRERERATTRDRLIK